MIDNKSSIFITKMHSSTLLTAIPAQLFDQIGHTTATIVIIVSKSLTIIALGLEPA